MTAEKLLGQIFVYFKQRSRETVRSRCNKHDSDAVYI